MFKAIKLLKKSGLIIKGASQTIERETEKQKGGFIIVITYIRCQFIRKSDNWQMSGGNGSKRRSNES